MNLFARLKLLFSRDIDEFFKKSRRTYVPVVKGGMWVDHETALCVAAVFAAVRYVSESVASLPWELRQRKRGGGSEQALTHPTYKLIHTRPNPEMSSFDWRVLMIAWANLWGNAYSEIERDAMGRVVALWPISPDRVEIKRNEGRLYYLVRQLNSETIGIDPWNMFHIRGMGGDGMQGYSVVALAARSIGTGLAADEFSASFYENSAITSGALKHPKELGEKGYTRLKEDFQKKHAGPAKAWTPMILEEGMEWQSMTMPLKDAQFLESRKFTVTEIARWFRVPPHKIGDLERATFSNIEEQNIDVVQDTLIPWAKRLELEADYKLVSPKSHGQFFSKVNVNGLLRGDSQARSTYYQQMRNLGVMNANEIRNLEDMNPIGPDGNKYVMQGQYTTLEKIGKEPEPPPPQLLPQPEEDEEEEKSPKAAWKPVFLDALTRIKNRRDRRVEDARKGMDDEKFDEWVEKSWNEHAQYIISTLRPIVIGYAQANSVTNVVDLDVWLNMVPAEWASFEGDLPMLADRLMDDIFELKEEADAASNTG